MLHPKPRGFKWNNLNFELTDNVEFASNLPSPFRAMTVSDESCPTLKIMPVPGLSAAAKAEAEAAGAAAAAATAAAEATAATTAISVGSDKCEKRN